MKYGIPLVTRIYKLQCFYGCWGTEEVPWLLDCRNSPCQGIYFFRGGSLPINISFNVLLIRRARVLIREYPSTQVPCCSLLRVPLVENNTVGKGNSYPDTRVPRDEFLPGYEILSRLGIPTRVPGYTCTRVVSLLSEAWAFPMGLWRWS